MLKRRPKLTVLETPMAAAPNDHIYIGREAHEVTGIPLIVLTIATNDSGANTTFSLDAANAQELAQTILSMVGEIFAENPGMFPVSRNAN